MLKIYEYNGGTWQFEESEAPKGAKLVEKAERKAATPQNKKRSPKNKAGE